MSGDQLPVMEDTGVTARVIAGRFHGTQSPVPTLSELFQVDVVVQQGASVDVPASHPERAIYVAQGRLDLGGGGVFDAGQLLVLKPAKKVVLRAAGGTPARLMLVGGEPMDGPRYIAWNFVSSSLELIEQAKQDSRDQKFPAVPDETEFIPLPEIPGKPVRYP